MTDANEAPLASNLRRLRRARGWSLVELARRAGTARATLTQLESGGGNPTLETLYALANALGAPLADLIATPPAAAATRVVRRASGTAVTGAAVQAWLLATLRGDRDTTEIFDFALYNGNVQHSAPHPAGTREHLHLHRGRARVGPASAPADIGPGDFVSFAADQDHLYQQLSTASASGTLIITRAAPA